ncbi:LysR substrate-binding domain-containing protein [Pseudaeromonas sharmana]|uniref:LysR substrate-binding domain-containing protein n=1 Tax=Pseudaeromonas sharmana TaxID=328412 RepID=A0ABV8CMH0_9GAMM
MDIRALRYFAELVQQQSFTRASEKLFVTQPTISKMVRSLEEEIGEPLLQRQGHSFSLTAAGELVLNRAHAILAELSQLQAELQDLRFLRRGQLHLGIPPMVGPLYADLLRRYRQRYPEVELSIVEYGGRHLEQAVSRGELDAALTMLPTRDESGLTAFELATHPIMAVLPNEAGWQGTSPVPLEALRSTPFLLYTETFTLSDLLQQRCRESGFTPTVAARSSQWDFLAAMVRSGMGVAFLPEPICRQLDNRELIFRPLAPALIWRLGVIWPQQRYLSRAAEAWLALCRDGQ